MPVVSRFVDFSGFLGTFGWDGGFGTTWYCDPREDEVSILGAMKAFGFPPPPAVMPAAIFCFVYLYMAFAGGGAWSFDGVISRTTRGVVS